MKTPTHPSYSQDETGQWWYTLPSTGVRSRCKINVCELCGTEFVRAVFQNKRRFCSRQCSSSTQRRTYLKGPGAISWKGGRQHTNGYVRIYSPDHPTVKHRPTKRAYVAEHRLVMEAHLGRYLQPQERVHHINGVKDDNRIENLELWTNGHNMPGVRMEDCKESYAAEVARLLEILCPVPGEHAKVGAWTVSRDLLGWTVLT